MLFKVGILILGIVAFAAHEFSLLSFTLLFSIAAASDNDCVQYDCVWNGSVLLRAQQIYRGMNVLCLFFSDSCDFTTLRGIARFYK